MTVTYQTNIQDTTYNGWANYETWNVALWIQNDEGLYDIARLCDDYQDFVDSTEAFITETPDGVSFTDSKLDIEELNEVISDLWSRLTIKRNEMRLYKDTQQTHSF